MSITSPDGSGITCYLTTGVGLDTAGIPYNGQNYLARIMNNDVQAFQAFSPQGYDTVPGFTLVLSDADRFLWSNFVFPHGWRGAAITLTVILWDLVLSQYSTDAYQFKFIGGNPSVDHAKGTLTVEAQTSNNFVRLKVPSIPIQTRCPWTFPTNYLQRVGALNDPTSIYFQDGYSADVPGGVGNLIAKTTITGTISSTATSVGVASATGFPAVPFQATISGEELLVTALSGTTATISRGNNGTTAAGHSSGATFWVPFTTCDLTRSSPSDPSVGCMARLGNRATTSVAPDGDIGHDIAGNITARFGGVTWLAPTQYSGKTYVTSDKTFGYNTQNSALPGTYYNFVYGTQWVDCAVLAPASDPNSLRSECVICVSAFGPANILLVTVNGVVIPQNNSDVLNTWRYINQGGRTGALNGDDIYDSHGDPHGSVCCFEFVVPFELAAAGSIPAVRACVTSGPILNCYGIASVSGGVVTLTGTNYNCSGNPPFTVIITGNSNPALNATFELSNWTSGPPGTITLIGTTASGTGGGVFFYIRPDLYDTGGDISANPSVPSQNIAGAAANPVFALLDLLTWGNVNLSQIDATSFYQAAQICRQTVTYTAANGSSQTHAQFKSSFAIQGNQRQTLASAITGLRNSANLLLAPNSTTGLIQCTVKQSLADQQPSSIPGSNYSTAVSSIHADSTTGNGFFAYLFDETNIDISTFKVTTTKIESTPNTVAFQFQDEQNGYQLDSITEIDPKSYQYSGNQEINVPIPIIGCPNFDQATRVSNVQLAESLFGNPRFDAGGTLYFEFQTNHRVLHLASRVGLICGLTWQSLGIGVSAPQSVRIMSAKPDTDGEHWQIKASWHNDVWYTYAYGQNPTPFQVNPLLGPPNRPAYPWRPGILLGGTTDALVPLGTGFDLTVDPSSYPAQVSISGFVPINGQPSGVPPAVPLQAATANTGGSLKPGTYFIGVSANGEAGPVSNLITAVIPAGAISNTITFSGLVWRSGAAASVAVYMGTSMFNMSLLPNADWTGSAPDSNGNDTAFTITSYHNQGRGLPDVVFNKFLVEETDIIHGGVFGDVVIGVGSGGTRLTLSRGGYAAHIWAGYILSLYYRGSTTDQPVVNLIVQDNTSTELIFGTATSFAPGDVVVMRASPVVTTNTIGDPNFVSVYAPGGLDLNQDAGNQIRILYGKGSSQPPKTILSNTHDTFTIDGKWDVLPDATSVFIVTTPTITYTYETKSFSVSGTTSPSFDDIAVTKAVTTFAQQFLLVAATADKNGTTAPLQYQPFREVYVPPQNPSGAVVSTALIQPAHNGIIY